MTLKYLLDSHFFGDGWTRTLDLKNSTFKLALEPDFSRGVKKIVFPFGRKRISNDPIKTVSRYRPNDLLVSIGFIYAPPTFLQRFIAKNFGGFEATSVGQWVIIET
jgi:hypothetical protein